MQFNSQLSQAAHHVTAVATGSVGAAVVVGVGAAAEDRVGKDAGVHALEQLAGGVDVDGVGQGAAHPTGETMMGVGMDG